MPVMLRCHKGIGPAVGGTALVAADNFSARYDLDRTRGVFSRPTHKLAGESYVDRILVLDGAKGGVATAWMLHEMAARGLVPRALIFNRVNPILAQGAVFAGPSLDPILIGWADIAAFLARYAAPGDKLDVVVFAAPQLSLLEIAAVAGSLDGRQIHPDTTVIVATSPDIKHAADRMGLTTRIEASGAVLPRGSAFTRAMRARGQRPMGGLG